MLRHYTTRDSITPLLPAHLRRRHLLRRRHFVTIVLLLLGPAITLHLSSGQSLSAVLAEDPATQAALNYPPQMSGADAEVYKQVGDIDLKMYIFRPAKHEDNESRPAIVFFFGSDWGPGTPAQFEHQCRHFARRGMIAITADYRAVARHGTTVVDAVMDGKSAIRWIRSNARRLGIDPDRITAAGGAEGGHVAVSAAVLPEFEGPDEDSTVSSQPNALALFGPAVVLAPADGVRGVVPNKLDSIRDRLGAPAERLCPYRQLNAQLPPTLIMHGTSDKAFPIEAAVAFAAKANGLDQKNAPVTLESHDGQAFDFFRFERGDHEHYYRTLLILDRFLVDRGLLEGPSPKSLSRRSDK